MKGRSHRAAGIAGRCHQDGQRLRCRCIQTLQTFGQKARTEVLECRGGAVKEFQREKRVGTRNTGCGCLDVKRRVSDLPDGRFQTITGEEAMQ